MACADVPRSWRRNAAIAVFLCLRDGEQRALQWPVVDLEHGMVHVAETFDRRLNQARAGTKGGAARSIPIPPALVPLLAAMKKAADGKGNVCPRATTLHLARDVRRWLQVAGVDRPGLHTASIANNLYGGTTSAPRASPGTPYKVAHLPKFATLPDTR